MPRSNSTRFSYDRRSGGLWVTSSAKSRLLKTVCLQSLHIRTSTPTCVASFSVAPSAAGLLSTLRTKLKEALTRFNVKTNLRRTSGARIATDYPSTSPAVMSSECVIGKLLLAKWTSNHSSVIFPRYHRLFQCLFLALVT